MGIKAINPENALCYLRQELQAQGFGCHSASPARLPCCAFIWGVVPHPRPQTCAMHKGMCWCWTRDDLHASCCSCPLLSSESFFAHSKHGEAAAGEVGFTGYLWTHSLWSDAKQEAESTQEWGGLTGMDVCCYGDTPSPSAAVSPSGHSGLQAVTPAQAASCSILGAFLVPAQPGDPW